MSPDEKAKSYKAKMLEPPLLSCHPVSQARPSALTGQGLPYVAVCQHLAHCFTYRWYLKKNENLPAIYESECLPRISELKVELHSPESQSDNSVILFTSFADARSSIILRKYI